MYTYVYIYIYIYIYLAPARAAETARYGPRPRQGKNTGWRRQSATATLLCWACQGSRNTKKLLAIVKAPGLP